jgi:hypothetical protein
MSTTLQAASKILFIVCFSGIIGRSYVPAVDYRF